MSSSSLLTRDVENEDDYSLLLVNFAPFFGLPQIDYPTLHRLSSENDGVILVSLKDGHAPTDIYVKKLREVLPKAFPSVIFYFQAADTMTCGLWKTDGTPDGTAPAIDPAAGVFVCGEFVVLGNRFVFAQTAPRLRVCLRCCSTSTPSPTTRPPCGSSCQPRRSACRPTTSPSSTRCA